MRMLGFPQNNESQPFPKTVSRHYADMADKEYEERAECEEMKASCTLPPVEESGVPGEASGDGRRHRYSRNNTERGNQEYDRRVA
jgi:hypothetical protein